MGAWWAAVYGVAQSRTRLTGQQQQLVLSVCVIHLSFCSELHTHLELLYLLVELTLFITMKKLSLSPGIPCSEVYCVLEIKPHQLS